MRERSEFHAISRQGSNTASARPSSLVGRDEEMRHIEAALARAANGRGGTIFLSGETGIGKTRLAQEAVAVAQDRHFIVLRGCAYPLGGSLAYSIFVDALSPFLNAQDDIFRARLVKGLPDLGRLFGDLNMPPPEPLGDPALERTRLFEAMARLFQRLAREAPLAFVLDDLHWADPASLDLLHYLARRLTDRAILLIAIYRNEDVDAIRGLRPLVRSLRRADLSEELTIPRLDSDSVNALARSILGGDVIPEILNLIVARTGGTPLFVEALIRFLVDSGHLIRVPGGWDVKRDMASALPTSVRELVLERLEGTDVAARHVLDIIAVGADPVPHDILQAISKLDDDALLDSLKRLGAAGLVTEETNGVEVAYALTHPLIQEVAYAELPEVVRQRTHASFAIVFERLRPDNHEQLAQHYQGAGREADQNRALDVLLAAGERAQKVHANKDAVRFFSAALTLVRSGNGNGTKPAFPQTPPLPSAEASQSGVPLLPWLLERLGEAQEQLGESDAALAVWNEALAIYEQADDFLSVARLRHLLANIALGRGWFGPAQSHVEAGLVALAGYPPSRQQADLLFTLASIFSLSERIDDQAVAVTELASVVDQLHLSDVEAKARLAEMILHMLCNQFANARASGLLALAAAEKSDEILLAQRVRGYLALLALLVGDHRQARHYAELNLQLARHLGTPTLEMLPHRHLAFADILSGNLQAAQRHSFEAIVLARRLDSAIRLAAALASRALALALSEESDEAWDCVCEAKSILAERSSSDFLQGGIVEVAELLITLQHGIREKLLEILARFKTISSQPARGDLPPLLFALAAEALVATGNPERAMSLANRLSENRGVDPRYFEALSARIEGLAWQALRETEKALSCQAQAASLFESLEMPVDAARARLEWAALAVEDHRAAAAAAAQESLATFEAFGARLYATQARNLLSSLGIVCSHDRGQAHLPGRRVPSLQGHLSSRELEVARLVADGLTNAEIAERLVISRRTVTTHLERIYARLVINSRAELAHYIGASTVQISQALVRDPRLASV